MKILLDANLSWRLVKRLATEFKDLTHFWDVNLPSKRDETSPICLSEEG